MTEGFLADATYGGINAGQWIEGIPEKSIWSGIKLRGKNRYNVQSWRCQRCGFLENYANA
jgi:hypothetical protein